MRKGDVVFVRGTGIISKLVRLFDKGSFSHVAIAVSDTEVIETNWNMRSKIVEFHYEDYEIVEIDLAKIQRSYVPVVARRYEGLRYDYIQIISFMFKGRLNNPRHLICSELVYHILKDIRFIHDESLRDATPNELYEILKSK